MGAAASEPAAAGQIEATAPAAAAAAAAGGVSAEAFQAALEYLRAEAAEKLQAAVQQGQLEEKPQQQQAPDEPQRPPPPRSSARPAPGPAPSTTKKATGFQLEQQIYSIVAAARPQAEAATLPEGVTTYAQLAMAGDAPRFARAMANLSSISPQRLHPTRLFFPQSTYSPSVRGSDACSRRYRRHGSRCQLRKTDIIMCVRRLLLTNRVPTLSTPPPP